jgi:hypothetical protein
VRYLDGIFDDMKNGEWYDAKKKVKIDSSKSPKEDFVVKKINEFQTREVALAFLFGWWMFKWVGVPLIFAGIISTLLEGGFSILATLFVVVSLFVYFLMFFIKKVRD